MGKGIPQNGEEEVKGRRPTDTRAEQSVLEQRKKFAAGGRLDSFKTQKDRLAQRQQKGGAADGRTYGHGATGMQHEQMTNLHAQTRDALAITADPLAHHRGNDAGAVDD